jgi:hypothetical protein
MTTLNKIRGLLLEEVTIHLLRASGYCTVCSPAGDPTLWEHPVGTLHVRGRGESHQIDAIASFFLSPPFSHPQRLLVEAKYHHDMRQKTGIEVIRNGVGVLKDVSEYWATSTALKGRKDPNHRYPRPIPQTRYHYQYAVVSNTGFTLDAEQYAYAQDVALIQVGRSQYFAPVLEAIRSLNQHAFGSTDAGQIPINESDLRVAVREYLDAGVSQHAITMGLTDDARGAVSNVCQLSREIQVGLAATTPSGFTIFIVASPQFRDHIHSIFDQSNSSRDQITGSIERDDDRRGWLVRIGDQDLFSFDMPPRVLELHLRQQPLGEPEADQGDIVFQAWLVNLDDRLNLGRPNAIGAISMRASRAEVEQFLREQRDARERNPG